MGLLYPIRGDAPQDVDTGYGEFLLPSDPPTVAS